MRRNTTTNTSQTPRQAYTLDTRVLPTYQRLLTPTTSGIYPYQTPPLQNGMIRPELFLIDRGRKSITIPGGLPVAFQPNPARQIQVQPSITQPARDATNLNTSRIVFAKNPEAPDTYRLLAQVLGVESKTQLVTRVPVTTTMTMADSRVKPQSKTQSNRSVITTTQSRIAPHSSHTPPTGSLERKRKSSSRTEDVSNADQKPVFVHTYIEHPTGTSSATRTHTHGQSSRHSSPSTATQSDHRVPHPQHSGLVDTPKTSTKGSSDASGSGRKRTHNNILHAPSPKEDTSNPTGKVLDRLSEVVWRNYTNSKQNSQRLYMKENLRQTLEGIIQAKYPGSMLFLVGSSLNGFATNHSDTDLCLMISSKELNQKHHAIYILNMLHRLILQRSNFVSEAQVIHAKVPILKFVCSRTFSGLECDVNINNATGIRNTHLLQTYSKLDWRVAPLIILIKQWASAQGINDASQGTLSSYSLVLMTLNYLQVKCKPCVIPCLHQMHSSTFNSHSDVRFLYDSHPSNPLPSYITFQSKNTETIRDLLRGFFDYYVNEFRFQSNVICVRLGTTYPLSSAAYNDRDWVSKYIYIEEPFDRNNTARAVYNDTNFRKIMQIFEKTRRRLVPSVESESDSDDPEDILNLRFEWSSKDTPPVKKKKR